jgi:hypothetical protein
VRSFFFLFFFSNLCFAAIITQDSGKSIAEDDTKLTDPKVFMEAMMSEMRRVMKMEMEQIHERIDQMENRRPALLSYFNFFSYAYIWVLLVN